MKAHSIFGVALGLLLLTSCQTPPGRGVETPPAVAASGSSLEAQFDAGKKLLEGGNHMEAIKVFAYLRDHAGSVADRDRAVIGLSMALQRSGNTGAALGVLEPLPEKPASGIDAMKCVRAGELYLQQQNFERARIWMARGLDFESEGQQPYRAAALFNLGKALLAEENLEDALTVFKLAQGEFDSKGDDINAEQCQIILADIDRALQ